MSATRRRQRQRQPPRPPPKPAPGPTAKPAAGIAALPPTPETGIAYTLDPTPTPGTGIAEQPPADLPERLLWKLWQRRAERQAEFRTEAGRRIRVLYPGRPASAAGPDFRDALLEVEGLGLVRGDIEIHRRQSDWNAHGHTNDPNYNGVALHAALETDDAPQTPLASGASAPVISLSPLLENAANDESPSPESTAANGESPPPESTAAGESAPLQNAAANNASALSAPPQNAATAGEFAPESAAARESAPLQNAAANNASALSAPPQNPAANDESAPPQNPAASNAPAPSHENLWALLARRGYPRPAGAAETAALLAHAGDERFRRRAAALARFAREQTPEQTLYEALLEALGYRHNQQPFVKLAARAPIAALRHAAQPILTAQRPMVLRHWLLAISGLAPDTAASAPPQFPPALGPAMTRREWHLFRVRPANHPAARIAGIAELAARFLERGLLTGLAEAAATSPTQLTAALSVPGSGGKTAPIGPGRARDLAVNAVLPLLHALHRDGAPSPYLETYRRFPKLPDNEILREMTQRLLPQPWPTQANTARHQQGLLHLAALLRGAS